MLIAIYFQQYILLRNNIAFKVKKEYDLFFILFATHIHKGHCIMYVRLTYLPMKENERKNTQNYRCCFLCFVLGDDEADHKICSCGL